MGDTNWRCSNIFMQEFISELTEVFEQSLKVCRVKCDADTRLSEGLEDTSALDEFLSKFKVYSEGGDSV